MLRRCASGTGIFHFTQLSEAPWTQFLVKLHLVLSSEKVFVLLCLMTSFLSIENLGIHHQILFKNTAFIKPFVHGPDLRIIRKKAWFIRKDKKLIKEKLNINWQVTSKRLRKGQEEWKIHERELQLVGLNGGASMLEKRRALRNSCK